MKRKWFEKAAVICSVLLMGLFLAACNRNNPGNNVVILRTSQETPSSTEKEGETSSAAPTEGNTGTTEPSEERTTADPTTEQTTESSTAQQETTQEEPGQAKAWDLLNNEPLNPMKSGYDELDRLIEGYFTMLKDDGILTDDMSQYKTVHSIYVWFIKNIVYNRGMDVDAGKYSSSDPSVTPEEVLWATDLLNTYQGCCYNYSSAFMYIMRALGYDAHLLSGQVSAYNGGMTPHCWVYVNLGGEAYTFDPDVDMNYYWRNIESGKEVTDTLFCRKMDTMDFFYTIEKYHTN